jgi:hypothetical protein
MNRRAYAPKTMALQVHMPACGLQRLAYANTS